jgi:HSP20 family protein
MLNDYKDILKHMEYEMQRCSAEAMRQIMDLPNGSHEFWLPRADVFETDDALVIRIEVAGIEKHSFNVSLSADSRTLHIRGTRTEKYIDNRRKLRYYHLEVYFGPFERTIPLPEEVPVDSDNLTATYRNGFLVVSLPKSKESQISRMIPIEEL